MRRNSAYWEPLVIALETLRAHKLRSFLMLLGIILSVSTLIVVVALIQGTNRYIANTVANMGSNVFLVNQLALITNAEELTKALRKNRKVTWEDYEYLRDTMRLPKDVGVETRTVGKVRYGGQDVQDIDVRGVTANIGSMDIEEPATGRYISDFDNEHRVMVAMIGDALNKRLFPSVDPLGKTILVDGREFEIVGTAKPLGTMLGQSQDAFVYIPIRTFLKIYGTDRSLSINVQARGPEWMDRTQEEARTLMRARRHLMRNEADTFGILASASLMDLWNQLTGAIAASMVGIVSVFLVIGGVVHHERHAGQRHRAHARGRHPQVAGRAPARHHDAVLAGGLGDGRHRRPDRHLPRLSGHARGALLHCLARHRTGLRRGRRPPGFHRRGPVFRGLSRAQGGAARSHRGATF